MRSECSRIDDIALTPYDNVRTAGLRKCSDERLRVVVAGGVDEVSVHGRDDVNLRGEIGGRVRSSSVAVLACMHLQRASNEAVSFQTLHPVHRYSKQFCPVVAPHSPYNIEMSENPRTATSKPSDLGVCEQPTVKGVHSRLNTHPRKLPIHPRHAKSFPRGLGGFLRGKPPILFPWRYGFLHASDED